MSEEPTPADYESWVRIANDPRESEETRAACRVRMERYVLLRLRSAFQAARPHPSGE